MMYLSLNCVVELSMMPLNFSGMEPNHFQHSRHLFFHIHKIKCIWLKADFVLLCCMWGFIPTLTRYWQIELCMRSAAKNTMKRWTRLSIHFLCGYDLAHSSDKSITFSFFHAWLFSLRLSDNLMSSRADKESLWWNTKGLFFFQSEWNLWKLNYVTLILHARLVTVCQDMPNIKGGLKQFVLMWICFKLNQKREVFFLFSFFPMAHMAEHTRAPTSKSVKTFKWGAEMEEL